MESHSKNIESIADLLAAIGSAGAELADAGGFNLWWRGHSMSRWSLVPRVHRQGVDIQREKYGYNEFRQMAASRYRDIPNSADYPGWLTLMQHYGLPTRLLDWSRSALIALYFAVEDESTHHTSGSISALNPRTLNHQFSNENIFYTAAADKVQESCRAAFAGEESMISCLAFAPHERDLRMMTQQTRVTIQSTDTPIENYDNCENFLRVFLVPAAAKHDLRRQLYQLGFGRKEVFPDLDNLAKHIRWFQKL